MSEAGRSKRSVLVLVLVAGTGLAWWLSTRGVAADPADAMIAGKESGPHALAGATVSAAAPGAPGQVRVQRDASGRALAWPPLPPVEVAFADIVEELRRRAATGDPKAACRLAAEISHCGRVKEQIVAMDARMRWMQDNPQAAQRRQQRGGGAEEMVRYGEQLLADDARCGPAADVAPAEKYALLRQAALAGHLPSMSEYASGNAFRMRDTLASLPALATYRSEAEILARRAADSGDLAMVLALAQAYSPARNEARPNLLAQVLQPDASESLALYLQVQQQLQAQPEAASARTRRALEQQIARIQDIATPAQRAEAESRARQRAVQWRPAFERAELLATQRGGAVGELQREHCDQDSFVR